MVPRVFEQLPEGVHHVKRYTLRRSFKKTSLEYDMLRARRLINAWRQKVYRRALAVTHGEISVGVTHVHVYLHVIEVLN